LGETKGEQFPIHRKKNVEGGRKERPGTLHGREGRKFSDLASAWPTEKRGKRGREKKRKGNFDHRRRKEKPLEKNVTTRLKGRNQPLQKKGKGGKKRLYLLIISCGRRKEKIIVFNIRGGKEGKRRRGRGGRNSIDGRKKKGGNFIAFSRSKAGGEKKKGSRPSCRWGGSLIPHLKKGKKRNGQGTKKRTGVPIGGKKRPGGWVSKLKRGKMIGGGKEKARKAVCSQKRKRRQRPHLRSQALLREEGQ